MQTKTQDIQMSSDWVLTEPEELIELARAKYNKIKKLEWMGRQNPLKTGEVQTDLTPDEIRDVLNRANKVKSAKILFASIRDENRHRKAKEDADLIKEWDYKRFYRLIQEGADREGKRLIVNETTLPIIKAMCFRLSNDSRYETELGLSFQKVLLIRGAPGLGKSWIPSLVADNPVCPMQIVNMNEITESVRETGEYIGFKFGSYRLVYIDDVGTEETPVKYYGTDINWFKTFWEGYYAKSKGHFCRLIFSTNEKFDEIGVKYGFRVRDRMREVCDVLDLTGESMRKS